jgi:hypothetical protein
VRGHTSRTAGLVICEIHSARLCGWREVPQSCGGSGGPTAALRRPAPPWTGLGRLVLARGRRDLRAFPPDRARATAAPPGEQPIPGRERPPNLDRRSGDLGIPRLATACAPARVTEQRDARLPSRSASGLKLGEIGRDH